MASISKAEITTERHEQKKEVGGGGNNTSLGNVFVVALFCIYACNVLSTTVMYLMYLVCFVFNKDFNQTISFVDHSLSKLNRNVYNLLDC